MAAKKRSTRSGAGTKSKRAVRKPTKLLRKRTITEPMVAAPAGMWPADPVSLGFGWRPYQYLPGGAITAAAPSLVPALGGALAAISSDMLGTRLSAVSLPTIGALQTLPIKVAAALDPRLQLALANHRIGKRGMDLTSTAGDEVAVVARVKSVTDWRALPDVFPGSELGKASDASWIVTGRVPIQRVEAVRGDATVLSLKASQPLHPALAATIQAMDTAPGSLPPGTSPDGGNGVVVGIVDFGCDFAHQNFRLPNGRTRLLALWHQAGITRPDSPFGYGRLYSRDQINAALTSPNPYMALGYGPTPDNAFQTGTHGTHVMDIAAGNGRGSTQPGVAPKADIVFVEVAATDIAWQGPESVKNVFGDSVQLLEAVRFVFDTAGDRPCVCNISLGTNGGPHDGTSLVEQGLDAIVRERPNRAIVIAASNSQADGIHASGQIPAAAVHEIVWRQRSAGGGEFELWYPGARRLAVTLVAADGTEFGPVQPGQNLPIGSPGQIAIFMTSRLGDPNNHDNVIGIWLAEGLPGEDWIVRLQSTDGQAVDYHAWIERNDRAQASFTAPVATHTLGSISTGHETVVVGSYDAHKPQFPLSTFSSSGPTRDGRSKPEVSAPGHNVLAARSRTGVGVVRKSGTSMAAPAVTGLIALILAEARRNNRDLPIAVLRQKLMNHTRRNPPAIAANGWDIRYGHGRANAASIGDN